MALVRQRGEFGCGAACLSMAIGDSIEEIEARLGHRCHDIVPNIEAPTALCVSIEEVGTYLWRRGSPTTTLVTRDFYRYWYKARDLPYEAAARRMMFTSEELKRELVQSGRRALLVVPAIGIHDLHMVYWTGSELLDPALDACYRDIDEPPLFVAVLIHDR